MGHDCRGDRSGCDRPPRTGTKRYQHASGDTGGWPKHGQAIRLFQQRKIQPPRKEIGDADRRRESDRADSSPCRISD
jgi:hypothetical protein